MYTPSHFEETRPEALHQLVREHPLGLLITHGADGLDANPVPFVLDVQADASAVLRAHVARANPVWREANRAVEALVVFQGPQAYVSPNWYAAKAEHGKVVPTWNYITVQARGPLVIRDDAAWVHEFVTRLTDRHEASQARPWAVTDAPNDYVDSLLRAIVGIEIPVRVLNGKWKLSQNRPAADRHGVAEGLRGQADANSLAMADWVARAGASRET